jgi:hypothetical protein
VLHAFSPDPLAQEREILGGGKINVESLLLQAARPGGALRDDAAAKALLRWAAAEREAWRGTVTNDPPLPGRILPSDYLGQRAMVAVHKDRRVEVLRDPVWQSQRDCVLQPKVARNGLPWVTNRKRIQPQRGCGKFFAISKLNPQPISRPIPPRACAIICASRPDNSLSGDVPLVWRCSASLVRDGIGSRKIRVGAFEIYARKFLCCSMPGFEPSQFPKSQDSQHLPALS